MAKKIEENFDPKKYMQMAIKAMGESKNEPRSDGKVSPKVGAVLIKPDGNIDIASRGELRYGDHAEFTLLERKKGYEKLDGSILFTTLEPCAPGARKPPKLGCAERIVNARLKEVWVGIEDPDPKVDRKGIKYLEDHGIKIHMFTPEFQSIIREENKMFLNQAIERSHEKETKKEVTLTAIENLVPNTDTSHFSEEALRYYIEKAKLNFTYNSSELWKHFEDAGLLEREQRNNTEIFKPTGFGILLFGNEPRAKFHQSSVKATYTFDNDKTKYKEFDDPLVLMPRNIEFWLKEILQTGITREHVARDFDTSFPMPPLLEAVINALTHRNYDLEGAKIHIEIDEDKIVIKSPGLPVNPISLEDLKFFKASSLSRNPKISYIFNKMKLVEESSKGMKTFKTMLEKFNFPLPDYSFDSPYLIITFSRSFNAVKKGYKKESLKDLNDEEIIGYEWIKSKGEVSKKEYASQFNFDEKKALRHLTKLKKLGLIKDNGYSASSHNYKYIYIDK